MIVQLKKIDTCKREMLIELEADDVIKRSNSLLDGLGKEITIPGYRQGKAPNDVVRRYLGRQKFEEEFIKDTIPELYREAVKQEELDVVGLPEISDVNFNNERFSFKAALEVRPTINLKNYKGLKLNKQKVEVTEEDLNRVYNSMKEYHKVELIDDNFIKGLGFSNLNEFEDSIKSQLFLSKERQSRQDMEGQITNQLLDMHSFPLPSSLLRQEEESLKDAARKQLKLANLSEEDIDRKIKEAEKEFASESEKRIKLFFILDEIRRRENIQYDDNHGLSKVLEFLFKEANWE